MNTRLRGKAASRGASTWRRGVLLRRIGLASEQRFIDVQVTSVDQPGVRGHEVPGREKNDIAGYNLRRRNVDGLSVAKRIGGERDLLAQTRRSVFGTRSARHIEDHGPQHDERDDEEARNVPSERRYGRRAE